MSEEIIDCPKKHQGCEMTFPSLNEVLKHIETECEFFGSKYYPILPKEIKNPESYPTPNVTKMIMRFEDNEEEELAEQVFFDVTQPQRNRILKKSDKQIRAGPQKFIKDSILPKTEQVEISKCLLKSNIMAVFQYTEKKRPRVCIALPLEDFNIEIRELFDLSAKPIVKLNAHKDIITELKHTNASNVDYLLSCSYDCTCKVWRCSDWQEISVLNYGNWVTSCCFFSDKFKSGADTIILGGGFNTNCALRIYDLEGNSIGDIKIKDNTTSIKVDSFHDELNQKTYIFNSFEGEKSGIHMFDYHLKMLVRTFPAEKYPTKLEFHIDNSNYVILTYVDFKGNLRQFNAVSGKLIKQINIGTNAFDLISFDEEYFLACGDHTENSFKVIYKDGLIVVKTYPNFHNNVILNLAYEYQNSVKYLVSLGADKQVVLYKK